MHDIIFAKEKKMKAMQQSNQKVSESIVCSECDLKKIRDNVDKEKCYCQHPVRTTMLKAFKCFAITMAIAGMAWTVGTLAYQTFESEKIEEMKPYFLPGAVQFVSSVAVGMVGEGICNEIDNHCLKNWKKKEKFAFACKEI